MRVTRPLPALVLAAALLAGVPASRAHAVVVDGVAAVVNGEVITRLELERTGRLALEQRLHGVPAEERERVRREVLLPLLEELVQVRIRRQLARRLRIEVSEAEIDADLAQLREDNRLSDEVLDRLLAERGMTRDDLRRERRDQLLLGKLVARELRSKITVGDEEIAAWYEGHRQEWFRPEKVRVRHLLVPLPPEPTPAEVEEAGARAAALVAQARAGADFAALVRAQDPAAATDADPVSGEIARGELFPALEQAAFALPVGGISEPVRSPAGFHVVQVAEKTAASEPTLAELRDSIEQKIGERKARERYESWLKQLRTDAIVEIRF